MPPDGIESLAHWRESGEWWNGENPREFHRYIDTEGIRREVESPVSPSQLEVNGVWVRRIRDEKVSLATGHYRPNDYGDLTAGTPTEGVLLHVQSAYTFGRGTMHAGEIPAIAAQRGYSAVLLADAHSLVGAREFCRTAKEVGIQPLLGITLTLPEGDCVVVAQNMFGYRSLSRLVTACHLEEPRNFPMGSWERLVRHSEGLICLTGGSLGLIDLALARRDHHSAESLLLRLKNIFSPDRLYIQIERSYLPWQLSVENRLRELAQRHHIPTVAGGPVLHANPNDLPLHDMLTCIDSLCLIDEVEGRKPLRTPEQPSVPSLPRRPLNGERFLRPWDDQRSLYAGYETDILNARSLVDRCETDILPGRINLPAYCSDEASLLHELVWHGAREHYPSIPLRLRKRIDLELSRIHRLGWARHFLIAWEMCEWAKGERILLSGRGSVVDSVIAYFLGISRINAYDQNLYFDRFLPPDGSKRPDIDIDFEAARREDVRQHLVKLYGADRVATVCAIGTYGTRGILREVGKVMGIAPQDIAYLSKRLHGGVTPDRLERALHARPELRDSQIARERYHWVFQLAQGMMDLPRNLRAHSSGVIISEVPIQDVVPVQYSGVEEVQIIQWDKRSAKACFDKYDVLCLRGNDVLGGTQRKVGGDLRVTDLPLDDPETYRTMRSGNLIGIPQSASPAMRQAHIRIRTENLRDASIVQAGIRPGVGGAVKLNEYVARRRGKHFRYVHPDMEQVLGPTLGIVVFQEQIDKLLEVFGGYTGDEAEQIRESIQKHHRKDSVEPAFEEIKDRITSRGYSPHVAFEVHKLVAGFKGYGFAEGHAYAFAEISVRSIYCQQNFPAPYFAALLDAQPAGYYGPITIANEARSRGVQMLPPHFNLSDDQFKVEDIRSNQDPKINVPGGGIRVPLRQISGLSKPLLERALESRPYESFFDFVIRTNPNRDELESMILAGVFDEFHANRRALLWTVVSAMDFAQTVRESRDRLPLFFEPPPIARGVADFSAAEKAIHERRLMGLDVQHHLMAFERDRVAKKGGLSAHEASNLRPGQRVFVVGNPIRLRFPPTSSGKRVMFFDLEDETGLLNVTCFDDIYQRDGHKVICNPYITLWGHTEDRDGHLSFMAESILTYRPKLEDIALPDALPVVVADFLMS